MFIHLCIYTYGHTAAAAKSLQSCPTLCDPIEGSPPGFPIPDMHVCIYLFIYLFKVEFDEKYLLITLLPCPEFKCA